MIPGEIVTAPGEISLNVDRATCVVVVANTVIDRFRSAPISIFLRPIRLCLLIDPSPVVSG